MCECWTLNPSAGFGLLIQHSATPKQQLDSLYLSAATASPLVSQKLASPVSTGLTCTGPLWLLSALCGWTACSGVPHEAHLFELVRCHPASSPGHSTAPQIAVNAEDAASLLYRYRPVSTCSPASLLLISSAVQLVSPSSAKLQPACSTPLPRLR